MRVLQILVTAGALLLAFFHALYPNITVDGTTVALLVIAIIPWLAPLFESLELPGGWKVRFRDVEKAREKAEAAGLIGPPSEKRQGKEYFFQTIGSRDPNLALAGLRIEIERNLKQIADAHGIETRAVGIARLIAILADRGFLAADERAALAELVGILNSAVHGAKVEPAAFDWALEVGSRVAASLELRAQRDKPARRRKR